MKKEKKQVDKRKMFVKIMASTLAALMLLSVVATLIFAIVS